MSSHCGGWLSCLWGHLIFSATSGPRYYYAALLPEITGQMLVGVLNCLIAITVCRDLGCLQGHSRGRTPNPPLLPPSILWSACSGFWLPEKLASSSQGQPCPPSQPLQVAPRMGREPG